MRTMRWVWVALLGGCAADSDEPMDGTSTGPGGSETQSADDDGDGGDDAGSATTAPSDDGDDGDDGAGSSEDGASTGSDDTGDPAETGDSTDDGGPMAEPPPTDADALLAWLQAGSYLQWNAESGPHPSAGPHFGTVRTFVDDTLFVSLDAGNDEHPVGAAAVKELYGDGDQVRGWSVIVKVALGAGGDGWYWHEVYDGTVFGDGVGDDGCTGCHGSGSDFVRSPFPLQ